MTYTRKTRDVYHVLVHYGQGWEHEATENTRAEAQAQCATYRANCHYPVKWERRRERVQSATAPREQLEAITFSQALDTALSELS